MQKFPLTLAQFDLGPDPANTCTFDAHAEAVVYEIITNVVQK